MTRGSIYRYSDGLVPNTLGFAYAVFGYCVGLRLLLSEGAWFAALGVLVVAHTLVIASYFIHELAHGTIFSRAKDSARVGTLFLWMTGSAWVRFADVRRKHLEHHAVPADILRFDFHQFLREHPRIASVTLLLEWAMIPAVDVLMRWERFIRAVRSGGAERSRVLLVLTSRALFFALLAALSPIGCALYALAYLLFLHVMRFMDTHQHTYDVYYMLPDGTPPEIPDHDKSYEDRHTYSNLISVRHPRLNFLTLNFGYHNIHHAQPAQPWYRLPGLHSSRYGSCSESASVLPATSLIEPYFRYRTTRVHSDDCGQVVEGRHPAARFFGTIGVSFLY